MHFGLNNLRVKSTTKYTATVVRGLYGSAFFWCTFFKFDETIVTLSSHIIAFCPDQAQLLQGYSLFGIWRIKPTLLGRFANKDRPGLHCNGRPY